MKRISRLLSIIMVTMMLAAVPGMGYAIETVSFNEDTDRTAETAYLSAEDGAAVPVDLSGMDGENAVSDELLVLLEEGTGRREISGIADDAGASVESISNMDDGSELASISLDDPEAAQQVAESLMAEDSVLIVQPNYIYRPEGAEDQQDSAAAAEQLIKAAGMPGEYDDKNGPVVLSQWHLDTPLGAQTGAADVRGACELLSGSGRSCVAVIDTGAAFEHRDFAEDDSGCVVNAAKCVSFNDGKQGSFTEWDNSDDDDGHGTHICGIIAAVSNDQDGYGVSGTACGRTELIVIDVSKPKTQEFESMDLVCGINYAVQNGADIINMSVGGLYHDYILEAAVNDAYYDHDVLSVCAAGNEDSDLPESPGDAAGAVGVMSHDRNGLRSPTSNYGANKDVSAPGVDILSTYRHYTDKDGSAVNSWIEMSGTSMASPVAAGLAALLKAEDGELSARELKNLIYTSSGESGFGSFGFGRINAKTAVQNLKSMTGSPQPERIELNRSGAEMYPGEYIDLEYAVYPGAASAFADDVSFVSSDKGVADVGADGRVDAIAPGEAVITAECCGRTAQCSVKVKAAGYETIDSLPYRVTGYFGPSDPHVKITNEEGEATEVIADSYGLQLDPGDVPVALRIECSRAKPYLSVFSPSGDELSLETSRTKTGGNYILRAYFRAEESGSHVIRVMGETDGSEIRYKSYTLRAAMGAVPEPIDGAAVRGVEDRTYTGKAVTLDISVICDSKRLAEGRDYRISYENNIDSGTAAVIISGTGGFEGSIRKTFAITKAGNGIRASGKRISVSRNGLKKKARTVKPSKAFAIKDADGRVSFRKLSGSRRLSIDRNGRIKVKRKTGRGTYKMKVKISASGDRNHSGAVKYATVRIKVK